MRSAGVVGEDAYPRLEKSDDPARFTRALISPGRVAQIQAEIERGEPREALSNLLARFKVGLTPPPLGALHGSLALT